MFRLLRIWLAVAILFFFNSTLAVAFTKGIYITQSTLEDTKYLTYLINQSKEVGIDTFIVDMELPSKRYRENIALIKENGLKYIARVVLFPDGAVSQAQLFNQAIWEKKYALMKRAIEWGAQEIQVDYIRYNTKRPASKQNSQDVLKVIQYFKARLEAQNIPMQVDIFGIASFGESLNIGQSFKVFAPEVNALCPMVYPSHYFPYKQHAITPYETIHDSLSRINKMFNGNPPFKLIPYIEVYNFRFGLSHDKLLEYIHAEIRATEDAGADGFYVWSPNNKYDNLFHVLKTQKTKG